MRRVDLTHSSILKPVAEPWNHQAMSTYLIFRLYNRQAAS